MFALHVFAHLWKDAKESCPFSMPLPVARISRLIWRWAKLLKVGVTFKSNLIEFNII